MKRLHAMLLSITLALGLATGLSTPASADHNDRHRIVEYNFSRITHGGQEHGDNYWNAINGIHVNSYGTDTHQNGITQTTTDRSRVIQVRIRDTGGVDLVSLYFWADSLYLAGFYAPQGAGPNRHFAFDDNRTAQLAWTLGISHDSITSLRRSGNYTGLPTGNNRSELRVTSHSMYDAARTLGRANGYSNQVGSALVVMITAFSEAARFGPIFNQVFNNVRHGHRTNLGNLVSLTNQWDAIARFVNDVYNHRVARITVLGVVVTNLIQLWWQLPWVELQGSVSRL